MNKLYITLLFAFLLSCFALPTKAETIANRWENFYDGINLSVYTPIIKDKDGYWVWVEYEYTTPLTQEEDVLTKKVIYSEKKLLVYSLNWRKHAAASIILYDKEGRPIRSYDYDDLDFKYIVPRTLGEDEMNFIKLIYTTEQRKQ